MEQQLLDYIKQETSRGVAEASIRKALADVGWENSAIEEAFAASRPVAAAAPVQRFAPAKKDGAAGDEEFDEETSSKKSKKPAIIAGIVFLAIFFVFGGLMAYFYFATSSEDITGKIDQEIAEDVSQETIPPVAGLEVVDQAPAASESEPLTDVPAAGLAPVENVSVEPASTTEAAPVELSSVAAQDRDAQRMADMQKLAEAQKAVFMAGGKYYTCGLSGGECGGKPYGYPAQIGGLAQTPQDPLAAESAGKKAVCGADYVYCGLNNAPYSNFFCYYAKLEGGGYYTASHAGNFKRNAAPKIFEECAAAD